MLRPGLVPGPSDLCNIVEAYLKFKCTAAQIHSHATNLLSSPRLHQMEREARKNLRTHEGKIPTTGSRSIFRARSDTIIEAKAHEGEKYDELRESNIDENALRGANDKICGVIPRHHDGISGDLSTLSNDEQSVNESPNVRRIQKNRESSIDRRSCVNEPQGVETRTDEIASRETVGILDGRAVRDASIPEDVGSWSIPDENEDVMRRNLTNRDVWERTSPCLELSSWTATGWMGSLTGRRTSEEPEGVFWSREGPPLGAAAKTGETRERVVNPEDDGSNSKSVGMKPSESSCSPDPEDVLRRSDSTRMGESLEISKDSVNVWSEKSPMTSFEAKPDCLDAGHWGAQIAPGYTSVGTSHGDPYDKLQLGETLNEKQRGELLTVLRGQEDVIAWDADHLGQTTIDYHRIDTGDNKPVFIRPYRNSLKENEIVREEVRKMLKGGIIRTSRSDWASPVVLVPKPSGEVRFCVDYRRLNDCTRKDVHPLPRIEDALDGLSGSSYFSALDLRSGYWQVRMHPDDVHKTAFSTQDGLYEFVCMPFGLTNAPATFQRVMNQVLGQLLWGGVIVYLDDIIIHTKTWEEHLVLIREVLNRLSVANLRISPSKSDFGFRELLYLGHIVSGSTVRMNPEKVRVVKEQEPPKNIRGVRAFLGLTSYYRRFVPDFAAKAKALNMLLQKNVEWCWGIEQQVAFEDLRDAITRSPVLTAPDFTKNFILQTDWSTEGLGAVLSQLDDEGEEKVIMYASRSLRAAEKNYAAVEGECLGIVWACRLFRPYLHGRRFLLQTDQQALTSLMKTEHLTGKLMRWSLSLQEFTFTVVHRKGTQNANADALSRLPAPMYPEEIQAVNEINGSRKQLGRWVKTKVRMSDTMKIGPGRLDQLFIYEGSHTNGRKTRRPYINT